MTKRKETINEEISYFAGCPHCDSTDGYINIGRGNWFICDRHKTQWYMGSIFSSWKDQAEEEQRSIYSTIADYHVVEPVSSKRWRKKWMSKNAPTIIAAREYCVKNPPVTAKVYW